MNRDESRRYQRIQLRVYERLPTITCKGLCVDSCGPLGMSQLERVAIEESGRPLDVTVEGRCTHLVDGRCSSYDVRPLLCRLFGVAEGLECPHGCGPSRILPRARAATMFVRVADLGGPSSFGPVTEELFDHIVVNRKNFPGG